MSNIPFEVILDILYGRCPKEREYYLCNAAEEYDEEICIRCWTTYMFELKNANCGCNWQRQRIMLEHKKRLKQAKKAAREIIKNIK